MNRFILGLIALAFLLPALPGQAQMPAAQRIPPALEKKVVVDAPASEVWEYISNPANYKEFSRVKEFWYEGATPESKIVLTNRKGLKRNQTIGIVIPEIMAVSYMVTESDYSTDQQWVYRFDIKPVDNNGKSEVVMSVYFGFDELPEDIKKGMAQEFDDIAEGLARKFR